MGVFAMPSLGADMAAGTLVEWLVKPGDTVERGDVVAVVETQKGAIEIEVFESGVVDRLLVDPGAAAPVGAPLAVIRAEGETQPQPAPDTPASGPVRAVEPAHRPAPATPAATPPAPPISAAAALRASPAARRRAETLGVRLEDVTGSGPDGAILLADIDRAAPRGPAPRSARLGEMRKAIAAAMTRSKRTIPHFYLSETIDIAPAIRFLEARNADAPPDARLLLGALFVLAAARAAAKVPELNGRYDDERGFTPGEAVNAGIAIALRGGGLVAPALMDAGAMTLEETMAGMRDLVARARAGRLRGSELTDGTITVSSLGETGAEAMTGVIFPPQVALVGLGAPHLRPWIVDGAVVPRHVVTLTLSADHRASDGRRAARFVAVFEELLQNPEAL